MLSRASNNSPRGLWSDGDVMYVADESDDRVYSYNMPDAIDAVSPRSRSAASTSASSIPAGSYEAVVADGVTETTVEAEAMQRRTGVAIDPQDADVEADGHQVALRDLGEITVTVTSPRQPDEGLPRAVPRDRVGSGPRPGRTACAEPLQPRVYEGGSVEELVSCAESRDIVALYALHEGVYVSHILGAPGFVNAGFLELFPDGLPSVTPLVAGATDRPRRTRSGTSTTAQPWPECLRGDIAALVVYEGGSVTRPEPGCLAERG